jgi:hypothetical protein
MGLTCHPQIGIQGTKGRHPPDYHPPPTARDQPAIVKIAADSHFSATGIVPLRTRAGSLIPMQGTPISGEVPAVSTLPGYPLDIEWVRIRASCAASAACPARWGKPSLRSVFPKSRPTTGLAQSARKVEEARDYRIWAMLAKDGPPLLRQLV